ncbi:MAG: DUF928 domain-containing protein [Crocosphaera sp.]|nr:DUF928 domain-containing protein [Crocosphaera sp.]
MNKKLIVNPFTKLTLLLSLITLGTVYPWLPSISSPLLKRSLISLKFPNTGNRGAPENTTGGGTRSEDHTCLTNEENEAPFVTLMPNRENKAKTATDAPTFYTYIPTTTATQGEFVLIDAQQNEVYYTQFPLPTTPGIITLKIPQTVALKPGNYTWSLMIVCDSRYRNRDKYVTGSIEYLRLTPELETTMKNKPSLEKAQLYATSSLWFEALDTLAQVKQENPQEWQELLESVGLDMLAEIPILDCCQPNQE